MDVDERARLARERLEAGYAESKAKVHGSSLYTKWRAMEPAHRVIFWMVLAFALAALIMLIAGYWDTPQVASPRGEGG